jgi:hypothetical protein
MAFQNLKHQEMPLNLALTHEKKGNVFLQDFYSRSNDLG